MKNLKLDEFPNWLKQKGNIRKHSRWNMGVYLVEDVNFSKEFPGYTLRKVGMSECIIARIKNFNLSDNMVWRILEDMGENFYGRDGLEKAEDKWESFYHRNILGKPFCNSWVIDKRFPFPIEFDDTTEILTQLYGEEIFEGWTNYMIHKKNRMFRYFLDIRSRMNRIKREQTPKLNWGATEWFVEKIN